MGEYDEDDHPRDENGRFSGTGGGGEHPKRAEMRGAREKIRDAVSSVKVAKDASHKEHEEAIAKLEKADAHVEIGFQDSQDHADEYKALNGAKRELRSKVDELRRGSLAAKQREKKSAQSDAMTWADSKLEAHDLKESAIGMRGSEAKGGSRWYSFDDKASAAHAGKITLDQHTLSKIAESGTLEGSKKVRELAKTIDVPAGHMVVYRVGRKDEGGLASKNGANAAGIADFLAESFDKGVNHGDTLHAYVVKKPTSYGKYDELAGGKKRQ